MFIICFILQVVHVSLDATSNLRNLTKRKIFQYFLTLVLSTGFVAWRLWFQAGPPKFQDFDNPPVFASNYFSRVSNREICQTFVLLKYSYTDRCLADLKTSITL
jgi:hypothetical protein